MPGRKPYASVTNWAVLAGACLWTVVAAARHPQTVREPPGRARLDAASVTKPVGSGSYQAPPGRRRRTLGDIVPAQYEQPTDEAPPPLPAATAVHQAPADQASHADDNPLRALLDANVSPIDLYSAFRLAGIQNSDVLVAQQRVIEAMALRQLAAVQFLPTLNFGTSIDSHVGPLQQSSGNILNVSRQSMFVGAGAYAIAAGTVNIPGVMWNLNFSETIYNYLASRKQVDRIAFESRAVEQDVLLAVALGYTDLMRAQGTRAVVAQTRDDARELARVTAAYARTGEGSQADADRVATELARREADLIRADGDVLSVSTRLCQLLHLDPSARLHAVDTYILPRSVVPEPIPLAELIAIAVLHRPELAARRAGIAQAMLNLDGAEVLPFSPTVLVGFSAGDFGGGSNIASQPEGSAFFARGQSRFGNFGARQDFDVLAYWTLRNLGVGNKALIDAARSRLQSADFEQLIVLDEVRSQVATAYARTHSRFARIGTCELAIQSGTLAFEQDMTRIRGHEGRPIEGLESLRLLWRAREEYLTSILDYNEAQFQLYVALGKPPVDVLVRPADDDFVAAGNSAETRRRAAESPQIAARDARRTARQPPAGARRHREIVQISGVSTEDAVSDAENEPPPLVDGVDIGDELAGLERTSVIPPTGEESLVDLPTALRLAESANPTIALGRQAICEALALQTEARGMLLPSLNAGMMYHLHQGRLQTSFGEIRPINEQSIYFGGGARTLAAETVAIPAVRIFAHLGDAIYAPLAAEQVVGSRVAESRAIANSMLLLVVSRYLELAGAEAELDALRRSENDMRQVVLATGAFARTGQGRVGDYERARAQALLLHAREQQAQEGVAVAAAELSRVLHLDPSMLLKTRPGPIEIVQLVDPSHSVEWLIRMAQAARPEMAARTADIAAADYRLQQECVRPWLPTISVGFSGGAFGGGSNRQDLGVSSFFQRLGGRTDFDVIAFWTLQNMGAGNAALQRQRRADRERATAVRGLMYNSVGREVGEAYARWLARRDQLQFAQRRLQTAATGAREEINRTRGGEGLPIETINSVDLLVEARETLIRTLIGYNEAQFELFVAVGNTPDVAVPDPLSGDGVMVPEPAGE